MKQNHSRLYRALLSTLLCLLVFFSTLPVQAYDNKDLFPEGTLSGGAHRLLNQWALNTFIDQAKADPILRNYDFRPDAKALNIKGLTSVYDLDGQWTKELFKVTGSDVVRIGATKADVQSIEGEATKTFEQWIIDGGFSADEPEKYMAWRHFYNPASVGLTYLTDVPLNDSLIGQTVQAFEDAMGESNPQTDSRTWALSHPDNPNSWLRGMQALEEAFSGENNSAEYAHAWRSIGQVLHSMEDMTVPAHVRNDSHPGNNVAYVLDDFRADAYEYLVSANLDMIIDTKDGVVGNPVLAKRIQTVEKPSELFYAVAYYVNTHFFSNDTIPYYTFNTETMQTELTDNNRDGYLFPYPDTEALKPSGENKGDYVIQDEKGELIMLNESWLYANGWNKSPGIINKRAVTSQAQRLIPIAIASSARMLDLSLPRITIDNVSFNQETLSATVTRHQRQSDGTYKPVGGLNSVQRMMVFLTLDESGKQENFLLPPVQLINGALQLKMADLERLSELLPRYLKDNKPITLRLGLDMGGILVTSPGASTPSITVDPVMLSIETGETVNFTAALTNAPKNPILHWEFRDGDFTDGSSLEVSHLYAKAGYYLGSVSLYDQSDKKKLLAKAEFGISVSDPELPEDPTLEPLKEEPTPPVIEPELPTVDVPVNPDTTDRYDYAAALAKWTAEFKADVDARFYHDEIWGSDCTQKLIYDVTPYIKFANDGQANDYGPGVYWKHHIDQTCVYFAGQYQGQTIVGTVNSFAEDSVNGGWGMSLGDLRGMYPEFEGQ